MPAPTIAVSGLAVMGQNLARNIARRGHPLVVHNRSEAKTKTLMERFGGEGGFVPAASLAELASAMDRPRSVILMVMAGAPVDAVIEELVPHLEKGDAIVDGGNSDPRDTTRRVAAMADQGIEYLGMGISGGEEGALHGPSLMPGGSRTAYDRLEPVLTEIAAQVDGSPCVSYIGEGGAGHQVKLVHNGIEYADMQLIAEAYHLLRDVGGLDGDQLADAFESWDQGDLDSFLIEITARILRRRDDDDPSVLLVDRVLDTAAQKGTGRLTAEAALQLGAPASTIAEAVFARTLSALKDDRMRAAGRLAGPSPEAVRAGVPTPAFSSALAWYDGYRSERLPANLIQAQRDLFGAHTYQRVDREGTFHSDWG